MHIDLSARRSCGRLKDPDVGRLGQLAVRLDLGVRFGIPTLDADYGATDVVADLGQHPALRALVDADFVRIQVKASRAKAMRNGARTDVYTRKVESGGRRPKPYGADEFALLAYVGLDIGRVAYFGARPLPKQIRLLAP